MKGVSAATPVTAYIGLGSNLEDPLEQVRRALAELDAVPGSRLAARSGLYRSPPMGPAEQPHYINAVAALETRLEPRALLAELQRIERAHGRHRGADRWGPRTLDLDLLLYGERRIREPALTVPHPGLHERAFVLYPLAEIAAGLVVPGHGPLRELLQGCHRGELVRVETP